MQTPSYRTLREKLDREGYILNKRGNAFMIQDASTGFPMHAFSVIDCRDPYGLDWEDVLDFYNDLVP